MLASSAVEHGIEPLLGKTKNYKFGICYARSIKEKAQRQPSLRITTITHYFFCKNDSRNADISLLGLNDFSITYTSIALKIIAPPGNFFDEHSIIKISF